MGFKPTDEQITAIEKAATGNHLAIEALAGAGKTSTLRLIAEQRRGVGRFIAFNKKIVTDAQGSFPSSVQCSTVHSMAMRAVGRRYSHRLNDRRITSSEMAGLLDLNDPWIFDLDGGGTIEIHPETIASYAANTVGAFCMSADLEIGRRHVPFMRSIDPPKEHKNNVVLSERVLPLARRMWRDLASIDGQFRFLHNHYLKLWHLEGPVIAADYLLLDEAQDLNPLMMAIAEKQDLQRIYVGDSNQQIYSWNGAVNALELADVQERAQLTQSFRFGPEIAEQANILLRRLGQVPGVDPEMVLGAGAPGRVGEIDAPDVLLGRSNAGVVTRALSEMARGRRVCVQGGTREVVWFAESAQKLQAGQRVNHPELACFPNWSSVQNYVEQDEQGGDLKLLVGLVDEFGVEAIVSNLSRAVPPHAADVTVSTAHKSKGAEWGQVKLLGDFPTGGGLSPEELRLMYVAVTRAQRGLDRSLADLEGIGSNLDTTLAEILKRDVDEVDGPAIITTSGSAETLQPPRLSVPRAGNPQTQRQIDITAARHLVENEARAYRCTYCGAQAGESCVLRRGPRAGLETAVHTQRVEKAAAAAGIRVAGLTSDPKPLAKFYASIGVRFAVVNGMHPVFQMTPNDLLLIEAEDLDAAIGLLMLALGDHPHAYSRIYEEEEMTDDVKVYFPGSIIPLEEASHSRR